MNGKRVLGVAIQGAGNVSTEHIRAYQRNPHTEVVAIGSRRQEGARAKAAQMGLDCAIYTDYEALLAHPGVDLVSICTPHDRHAIETIGAARAGKHLLIEKPVAINPRDLRVMGGDVVEVTAPAPADEGKDRPARSTIALVRFANGGVGKVAGSSRQKMPYVFNIELYGEAGSVRNNRVYSDLFPGQTDFVEIPTVLPDSGDVAHHPFPEEIDHLVDCILNDR